MRSRKLHRDAESGTGTVKICPSMAMTDRSTVGSTLTLAYPCQRVVDSAFITACTEHHQYMFSIRTRRTNMRTQPSSDLSIWPLFPSIVGKEDSGNEWLGANMPSTNTRERDPRRSVSVPDSLRGVPLLSLASNPIGRSRGR